MREGGLPKHMSLSSLEPLPCPPVTGRMKDRAGDWARQEGRAPSTLPSQDPQHLIPRRPPTAPISKATCPDAQAWCILSHVTQVPSEEKPLGTPQT